MMEERVPVPTQDLEESALADRLCSGDPEAFRLWVNQHKDQLVNYLTKLTGQRSRAEDLAQEGFLRFYRTVVSRPFHNLNPVPYLYRIVTNLLRSEERKARRFVWVAALLKPRPAGPADSAQAQEKILQDETRIELARALARLPLRYRVPLVLREIELWAYRDIADVLNLNEGTVKSRIHRGKAILKQQLEAFWQGGSR